VHDLRGLREVGERILGGGRARARRKRNADLHAQARG